MGIVLVTIIIAIAEREFDFSELPATALLSLVATIATTSLTLVALVIVDVNPLAIVLLVVPSSIVFVAFRAYVSQRRRHEHLEFLYESMQTTQTAPEFGLAIGQLLIAVRRLVRAEFAEILLFPTDSDTGLRSTINSLGEIQTQSSDATTATRRHHARGYEWTGFSRPCRTLRAPSRRDPGRAGVFRMR